MLMIAPGCALTLSACAFSPPLSTGERLTQRGGDIASFGEDWPEGRDTVAQGRKSVGQSVRTIEEGEKDLARAKDRVLKTEQQISAARSAHISGERQIAEGTLLMHRAEADYAKKGHGFWPCPGATRRKHYAL